MGDMNGGRPLPAGTMVAACKYYSSSDPELHVALVTVPILKLCLLKAVLLRLACCSACCSLATSAVCVKVHLIQTSLVPRPHPNYTPKGKGLVAFATFLGIH